MPAAIDIAIDPDLSHPAFDPVHPSCRADRPGAMLGPRAPIDAGADRFRSAS